MKTFELSLLPTAVDVTLYKYNYIDNTLWTRIQNEVDFIQSQDNSVLISAKQLQYLLDTHYTKDVNRIKSLGTDVMHKEVNSIYFLYRMLTDMVQLQYIKFNFNTDKGYNRLISVDGKKVLQFGFKIITATLRLSDLYDDEEILLANKALYKMGILSEDSHYTRIFAGELADRIDSFLEENEEDDYEAGIVADILDVIESKLEPENTLILLITDY